MSGVLYSCGRSNKVVCKTVYSKEWLRFHNKAKHHSRCAPWTALPSLLLCMASPFTHKTINNKSAAVGNVKFSKKYEHRQ